MCINAGPMHMIYHCTDSDIEKLVYHDIIINYSEPLKYY